VMDPVWHNVGQVFQRSYTNGPTPPDDFSDLMGWSRFMWDNENIYALLYTQDDILQDVHTDTYQRDCWEVYFDGDNSKLEGAYDTVDDMQLRFGHSATTAAEIDGAVTYFVRDGVEFVNLDNPAEAPSGYMLEIKLPLANIHVEPETIIGFELQQNDNDGTARDHISKWWVESGDPSWNNASTFGEAVLTNREISETLEIPFTDVAPVIDGVWEASAWEEAVPFQINSFDNMGTPGNWPDSYEDDFGRMWAMYDNENFYMYFEGWDEIIQDVHTDTYQRDCFEVYFDGDNSKTETYDALNDMQLRFGHWATAVADIDGATTYFVRDGVEFMNMDTDMGWDLEVKFPMSGIQLEPVAGSEFGFEVQQGDNDGTAREAVTKWWTEIGDPSWNNASGWGNAYLSARKINAAVDEKAPVARNFGLSQNYPNPFNPTTTVPFSLKSAGKVRLSVFDMMGREVAVLVDGIMPAGSQTAQFSANNLSSGIYFCKLQTADNVMTTKMTLMK